MISLLVALLLGPAPAAASAARPALAQEAPAPEPAVTPDVADSTDSDEVPFDPKNYPRRGIEDMRRAEPCSRSAGPYELKDLLFSSELRWHGDVRRTPQADYELVRRWTRHIGDPGATSKYGEEATLSEGRRLEWVSVPEGLLAYLQMDLEPGDRVVLYLVYAGCARGRAVFTVDEYEVPEQTDLEGQDELILRPAPPPPVRPS